MKNVTKNIGVVIIASSLFTSCATIFGGSKYYAHVVVSDRTNAKIFYQGEMEGTGSARFKVKRSESNEFSFTVREDGCTDQSFKYVSRTFRGWAFIGTLITFTGITDDGIPIPFGAPVDLLTGAIWKPNTSEKGIIKEDYNNFKYVVNYTGCTGDLEKGESHADVVYLKNGSIIKGIIIEEIPNVQIKIQIKNGNTFVYKIDEIEKMTKEFR